ncbi:hypothetical protein [uncultured Brevundimonas sp.]|uniref:hypothetical protein n=1 Tax=uncultured Brevundimonas sp. TaxID=213418 RepID=UPI002600425B|nr:hypothetical protein [uncultured Brevundimonas sp.]
MSDLYQVRHDTFDELETATISEGDFVEVQDSLRRLALVMQVEETFDIAVSNYAEFEKAVAEVLIGRETRRDFSGVHWHSTRRDISRVASNLLSSVRTFQHVAESAVSAIYGATALADHQGFKSRIYDGSFTYRVMEKLRNHAQHQGLAVNSQTYSSRWLDTPGQQTRQRIQAFRPELDLRQFADLPRWKGVVSEYLALREGDSTTPDRLNLHKLVRGYMTQQSEIVTELRQRWSADLDVWDAVIRARRDLIPHRVGENAITETIAVRLRGDTPIRTLYISQTLLSDIRRLEEENRPLLNLDKLEMRL